MGKIITAEEILDVLIERNKPAGFYFLAVLKLADKPIPKDKLCEEVNKQYKLRKGDDLIKSRHKLDQITNQLLGAGLVNVEEISRARLFTINLFGEFILEYNRKRK